MSWANLPEHIVFALIFSFHMPLFFLLSGITSRYSTCYKSLIQNSIRYGIRLLIPAVLVYLAYCIHAICLQPYSLFTLQFLQHSYGVLYGWFFIGLYNARLLFDFMQLIIPKKLLLPFVLLTGCVGTVVGNMMFGGKSPIFFVDIAMTVTPFLYVGYKWQAICSSIKELSKKQKILILLFTFIGWLTIALVSYKECFSVVDRSYPLYPLCFVGALAGSSLLILLAQCLAKIKLFLPIQFLGRYCIYFFFIHCIDTIWQSWYMITNNNFLNFLTRVAINLAFFLILVGLRYIWIIIKKYTKRALTIRDKL